MILFPNCKINLGLNVIEKRSDGYHNIETIFYPIDVKDILEIVINKESSQNIQFTTTGLTIEGDIQNNLCIKAYQLLKKDFDLPPVKIHLHKQIPMGAGLGGGSANGAFTLLLLNQKFNLNIDNERLIKYALQLGSDCPFFIYNQSCFAKGRGEILKPISLDLSNYKILVVNPKIHVSTAQAFSNITPINPTKSLFDIVQQPLESWKTEMINDFEKTVFKIYPEIEHIKQYLYSCGAVYASMSGTGSTVYGIFDSAINTSNVIVNENYMFFWV